MRGVIGSWKLHAPMTPAIRSRRAFTRSGGFRAIATSLTLGYGGTLGSPEAMSDGSRLSDHGTRAWGSRLGSRLRAGNAKDVYRALIVDRFLSEPEIIRIMDAVQDKENVRGVDYSAVLPDCPRTELWKHGRVRKMDRLDAGSAWRMLVAVFGG